jgi:hypothetical protein
MENYTPYSSQVGVAWWVQHCHLALGKSVSHLCNILGILIIRLHELMQYGTQMYSCFILII